MGKGQKKTGKGRLDKFYKLAKEQGYRARSAFKLIQLNKKYNFLEGARCCIDLCAAPGGWLQVASKYMPPNSIIVGVDLDTIRPIPRVVTFAADITTPLCRQLLRAEVRDWKADVVLHDGAPNVGTAWIQDAYSQSELVLMSLKLAVEFLAKGGTFVTKVFRSVDYNNLIWVFNQLFGKVEATKPPSSRNVSAEIFVVCHDFLAPKHIDPKFLDPRHVFKDLGANGTASGTNKGTSANNIQMNVFQPEKKRRKRDGYDEGDYTLYHTMPAGEYIRAPDPIHVLGTINKITFDEEEEKEWLKMDCTTPDVKANCEDLKVLGKGDFKALIKWRIALREEIGLDKKDEEAVEVVEITEEVDEEQAIQEELERLNAEAAARTKRERRRANEVKTRTIQRMQLSMTAPMDIGLEMQDASLGGQDDVFDLLNTENIRGGLRHLGDDDLSDSDDEGPEQEDNEVLDEAEEKAKRVAALEGEIDDMYGAYQAKLKDRDAKYKVQQSRLKNKEREEWGGIKQKEGDSDEEEEDSEGGWDVMEEAKENAGENSSSDDNSDSDEDEEDAQPVEVQSGRKRRRNEVPAETSAPKRKKLLTKLVEPIEPSKAANIWFSQDMFAGLGEVEEEEEEDVEEEEEDIDEDDMEGIEAQTPESDDGDDFEIVAQNADDDVDMWDVDDENEDKVKRAKVKNHALITAEAVTIAQQLVNRETTRTHLINEGFSRYSLNSKDGLPTWFLDDENKFYKPNLPITKEAVDALKAKQRELDARPIKKVAEAKARKKFKQNQQLTKALRKADTMNENTDMSEKEKAKAITKVMNKGLSSGQKKKNEKKLVVAKGSAKGIKGRPKGVKGRYTMVDSRMKKELRAKKRADKAKKKR